ncbi:MAG: hypothetical protein R3Y21_05000 [Mycoplasmatota bacterium]
MESKVEDKELKIKINGNYYTPMQALQQFGNDPDALKEIKTAIVNHINGQEQEQEQEQFGEPGGITR